MVSRTARSPDVLAIPVREDLKTPFHIDLRAVIGGTIVALGVWAMLLALGLVVGLTSIDPDALFFGAVVAARSSGPMKDVETRIGAARAKQTRDDVL